MMSFVDEFFNKKNINPLLDFSTAVVCDEGKVLKGIEKWEERVGV